MCVLVFGVSINFTLFQKGGSVAIGGGCEWWGGWRGGGGVNMSILNTKSIK